jgi:phosphatidylserine synthase
MNSSNKRHNIEWLASFAIQYLSLLLLESVKLWSGMNLPDNVELGLFGCACVSFLPVPISVPVVIWCTKSAAMKMLYRLLGYVQSRNSYVNDSRFHMVCLKIQEAVQKITA